MNKCTKCKRYKPVKEFAWKNRNKGTRNSNCKMCHRKWNRNHYASNKIMYRDKNRQRRTKLKEQMRSLKESSPCKDCGIYYPFYVMDFDHVRGKKKFTLSFHLEKSISELKSELLKCELVCSNCHRTRTHRRKYTSMV